MIYVRGINFHEDFPSSSPYTNVTERTESTQEESYIVPPVPVYSVPKMSKNALPSRAKVSGWWWYIIFSESEESGGVPFQTFGRFEERWGSQGSSGDREGKKTSTFGDKRRSRNRGRVQLGQETWALYTFLHLPADIKPAWRQIPDVQRGWSEHFSREGLPTGYENGLKVSIRPCSSANFRPSRETTCLVFVI